MGNLTNKLFDNYKMVRDIEFGQHFMNEKAKIIYDIKNDFLRVPFRKTVDVIHVLGFERKPFLKNQFYIHQ